MLWKNPWKFDSHDTSALSNADGDTPGFWNGYYGIDQSLFQPGQVSAANPQLRLDEHAPPSGAPVPTPGEPALTPPLSFGSGSSDEPSAAAPKSGGVLNAPVSAGLHINLIADDNNVNAPAGWAAAVQTAADIIEQNFSDPVTINLRYGYEIIPQRHRSHPRRLRRRLCQHR